MSSIHPKVLLVCNSNIYKNYISPNEVKRLEKFASWDWFNLDHANIDAQLPKSFFEAIEDVDALVISHGSPPIGAEIMDSATRLRFIGELEDDRFNNRIDLRAAWERNVRTVDTTNGSSYPVAEWALALILISEKRGSSVQADGQWEHKKYTIKLSITLVVF